MDLFTFKFVKLKYFFISTYTRHKSISFISLVVVLIKLEFSIDFCVPEKRKIYYTVYIKNFM